MVGRCRRAALVGVGRDDDDDDERFMGIIIINSCASLLSSDYF